MSIPPINAVWIRIKNLSGQQFLTKSGKPFTYSVSGDVLNPSRTDYNLSKSDFEKALALAPLDGPGAINQIVRGPAYIWAVLHDPRVRGADW